MYTYVYNIYLFSIWTFKLFSWRTDISYLLGGGPRQHVITRTRWRPTNGIFFYLFCSNKNKYISEGPYVGRARILDAGRRVMNAIHN